MMRYDGCYQNNYKMITLNQHNNSGTIAKMPKWFITSNFSHSTQISTIDITKIKSYPLLQYIGLILIYTILSSLNHGILHTTRGFTTSLQYDSVMSADVMLSKQACVLKETLSSVTFTPQSIITFQPNNALKVQVFGEDDIC